MLIVANIENGISKQPSWFLQRGRFHYCLIRAAWKQPTRRLQHRSWFHTCLRLTRERNKNMWFPHYGGFHDCYNTTGNSYQTPGGRCNGGKTHPACGHSKGLRDCGGARRGDRLRSGALATAFGKCCTRFSQNSDWHVLPHHAFHATSLVGASTNISTHR